MFAEPRSPLVATDTSNPSLTVMKRGEIVYTSNCHTGERVQSSYIGGSTFCCTSIQLFRCLEVVVIAPLIPLTENLRGGGYALSKPRTLQWIRLSIVRQESCGYLLFWDNQKVFFSFFVLLMVPKSPCSEWNQPAAKAANIHGPPTSHPMPCNTWMPLVGEHDQALIRCNIVEAELPRGIQQLRNQIPTTGLRMQIPHYCI